MPAKFLIWFLLGTVLLGGAQAENREERIEIRVASYASSDSAKKENRLLIVGQTACRSIEELKQLIGAFAGTPGVHFVVYGTCKEPAPRLTSEEIEEIRGTCAKAGVRFTYFPGG